MKSPSAEPAVENIATLLERQAASSPARPAIVEPSGRAVTFAQLEERAAALDGALGEAGFSGGARFLLLVPMCIELYVALGALFRGGFTAVLLDPSAPRVADNLAACQLAGFIGSPLAQLLRLRYRALRGLDLYLSTGFVPLPHRRLQRFRGAPRPISEVAADLPALLTFTTGSTGTPKGVARTHGFLFAQHRILAEHMELGPDDVDLPTLPVFLINSLAAGATCILPDTDLRRVGDVTPGPVIAQLKKHRCTVSSGSPAFFAPIAKALRAAGETLPDLRKIFTGGARVPPSLVEDLVAVAPNARIEVLYGSTEAEPIARLDARVVLEETGAAEVEGKGSCVGEPVAGIQVRMAEPGTTKSVAQGEVGEIIVAGDHVNRGYYRNPQADAELKLREGDTIWHRTGDTGYFDASGRIWLVGRVSDVVAGRHPFLIEAPAEHHPWVRRAALVDVDGRAVLACTVTDPPANWRSALAERFEVDAVVELREMPVDPRHNAKIDRPRARAAAAAALGQGAP